MTERIDRLDDFDTLCTSADNQLFKFYTIQIMSCIHSCHLLMFRITISDAERIIYSFRNVRLR